METQDRGQRTHTTIEPVLSLTELAAHPSVPAQTIYRLRSKGCGRPASGSGASYGSAKVIDAWLARLEARDGHRNQPGATA